MLVQANADLKAVAVKSEDETENWDDGDGPTPLWSGSERAYYQERREFEGGAEGNLVVHRALIVEEGVPAVVFAKDQTVTFRIDGEGADTVGTVEDTRRARWAPAGPMQTTKLTLRGT